MNGQKEPTINILISTIDERVENVKNVLLDPRDDVEYIVSHQYTEQALKKIPSELKRSDVTVSQIEGKGVARSRNNALKLATGDIALISDDDVRYNNSYIDTIQKAFINYPQMDVALFKIKTPHNEEEYKKYPKLPAEFKKKMYSVSSIEIAFNIKRIHERNIVFDERFGAGQELVIGSEEIIFIEDCLKSNLKIRYIPEYIVEHPRLSTVNSIPKFDKRRIWVTGAYDCRTNGSIALVKAFLGTIKMMPELMKHKVNPLTYFYHRLSAVIYILRTNQ